jgi:hypothetical protein
VPKKPTRAQFKQSAIVVRAISGDDSYGLAKPKAETRKAQARDPLGPSDAFASGSSKGGRRTRSLGFDFTEAQVLARDEAALKVVKRIQPVRYHDARTRDLPVSMQHTLLNAERKAFQSGVGRKVRRRLTRGWRVFHLTVANPRWNTELDELDLPTLAKPKEWIRRRAEGLAKHGKFILGGFIDLSFVDRSKLGKQSFWSPHAHVLIAIKTPENYDIACVIRNLFHCKRDNANGVKTPVDLEPLRTIDDIIRVERYLTSKLYPECRQLRVPKAEYRHGTASKPDRRKLRQVEQDVLYPLLEDWAPSKRWILAGLKRQGSEVIRFHSQSKIRRDSSYYRDNKAQNGPVKPLGGYDSYLDE